MAVRLGARWLLVLTCAVTLAVLGRTALLDNSAVRPMWTGPNAVAIAQHQVASAATAATQARQAISTLQIQTQELTDQADQVAQWLQQAGVNVQQAAPGSFATGGDGQ